MPRKTIHAVISEVLKSAGRPMSAQEIYEAIRRDDLYEFKAKDPLNIIRNQLQRHCVENDHSGAARTRYFTVTPNALHGVLQEPIIKE